MKFSFFLDLYHPSVKLNFKILSSPTPRNHFFLPLAHISGFDYQFTVFYRILATLLMTKSGLKKLT